MKQSLIRPILLAVSFFLFSFDHSRTIPDPGTLLRPESPTCGNLPQSYAGLPMAFEKNEGQADPSVRYTAWGLGYQLYLTPTQAVWCFQKPLRRSGSKAAKKNAASKPEYLWMKLKGANPRCEAEGLEALPGRSNFLAGGDPSRWRTNLSQYSRVKFREVYPHIDLVYYGANGKLEYDFIVNPGGNPKDIKIKFVGMKSLELDKGDLAIRLKDERLGFKAPVLYQRGWTGKRDIGGRFVQGGAGEVGFEVEGYDPSRPLVIDPTFTLAYSTYIGSPTLYMHNEPTSFYVDPNGYTYFVEPGPSAFPFPTTPGAYQSSAKGTINVIIVKLNQTGSALVYATYLGGTFEDQGFAITADAGGNAYLTGFVLSSDFPTTAGAYKTGSPAGTDAFVTKLNPGGTALVYSTLIGGSNQDRGMGIAVDNTGNAYVGGFTQSTDFPTTAGAFMTVKPGGSQSLFVTKLNTTGTALVYSTYLGGSGTDQLYALAIDGSGNAYLTGNTTSTDFPTTAGAYRTTAIGTSDVFVTKLNPTGTGLVYSTYLGGSQTDQGQAIAVDASGNAYVTGYTASADFPTTPGVLGLNLTGSENCFVTKLDAAGSNLVFSTYLGGKSVDIGYGIAVDGSGQVYVGGLTASSDFPTTPGALKTTFVGSTTFFSLLNPTGTSLAYSTFWGGTGGEDDGAWIGLDSSGAVYLGGSTYASDYPTTAGAYQTTHSADNEDLFAAKLVMGNTYTPTVTATNSPTPSPTLTFTVTSTPSSTSTSTPTPTGNATDTPTPTGSWTDTPTFTPTLTFTPTITDTPTLTGTFTPTGSYTMTFTSTPTFSPTFTNSPTLTATPTNSPAFTFTPTVTSTLGSSSVDFCPPYPNPVVGPSPVSFCVDLPQPSLVQLGIFTTAFRKIYDRHLTLLGQNILDWDLRDQWGAPVANGLYYLRIQVTGPQPAVRVFKILVIR